MYKQLIQGSWLTHLFFITLFLIVPTLAFVRPPSEPFFALTRVFVQDTSANFVLLCFFYLNYYFLLPTFFLKKKYLLYSFLVVLFISTAFAAPSLVGSFFPDVIINANNEMLPLPKHFPDFRKQHFSLPSLIFDEFRRHLALFFTAIFFSILLKTREYLSLVKEEKLHAELSNLKAQINPHFLFNTLNSIYALSVKKDSKTSSAILHLSGLMRYIIAESTDNKIALEKEIDYLESYIELQRARLGNTVSIYFRVIGTLYGFNIIPLVLITYIENAFKYGVNPNVADCKIDIDIKVANKLLEMSVKNRKVAVFGNDNATRIGIKNTQERLSLLYPAKHSITILDEVDFYSVKLIINLA